MKVILAADVDNLGKKGDVKDLADGYVRNFLLPKKLVLTYNEENLKQIENLKKNEIARREKEQKLLTDIRHKLEQKSITVHAKLGKDNKFFGSITKDDVAKCIEQDTGIKIDKHNILLEEPIRDIGVFTVEVKLNSEKFDNISETAKVKLWIIGK